MSLTKADLESIGSMLSTQRKDITKDVEVLLAKQRKAINQDISEFVSDSVLPLIDKILINVSQLNKWKKEIGKKSSPVH
jgi:hypothetical protein